MRHEDMEDSHSRGDREITLGTMTILGIFFALAVLCAGFFGFGYSTGRRSTPSPQAAVAAAPIFSGPALSAPKPSAASPISFAPPAPQPSPQVVTVPLVRDEAPLPPSRPAPVTRAALPEPPPVVRPPTPALPAPPRPAAVTPSPMTTPVSVIAPGAGQFMVQVAAVSHPEDADLLVTTLRRAHYNVAIHHEPQDKLLHVQIGPISDRKEAEMMRQRLLADGFNAIVK